MSEWNMWVRHDGPEWNDWMIGWNKRGWMDWVIKVTNKHEQNYLEWGWFDGGE